MVGERDLDKGLSSHRPGFEGPKGVVTKGFLLLSAISASMIALQRPFLALISGSCFFRGW